MIETMKNLKNLSLGITLFSMFFGAGNLIFAPWMGAQAGAQAPLALLGFLATAVILPIFAIITIAPYGSARNMISRIWKPLGPVFMTIVYLLIGPCIAIPRTASTSFEMWIWAFSDSLPARLLYTLAFFGTAWLLARYPGRLKDLLGKVLGPLLIVLVFFVCVPLFFQSGSVAPAALEWSGQPVLAGLNEGYQTMDILAALCFGIVFMINIRASHPVSEKKTFVISACIAGLLLGSIYTLLTLTAMQHGSAFAGSTNGADILSVMAGLGWGPAGQLLCGLIFLLACLNVCAGLLASCSEYFCLLLPKIRYQIWLGIFAVAGSLAACLGLDSLLALSGAILPWICPIAILFLFSGWIRRPKTLPKEAAAD